MRPAAGVKRSRISGCVVGRPDVLHVAEGDRLAGQEVLALAAQRVTGVIGELAGVGREPVARVAACAARP